MTGLSRDPTTEPGNHPSFGWFNLFWTGKNNRGCVIGRGILEEQAKKVTVVNLALYMTCHTSVCIDYCVFLITDW